MLFFFPSNFKVQISHLLLKSFVWNEPDGVIALHYRVGAEATAGIEFTAVILFCQKTHPTGVGKPILACWVLTGPLAKAIT